MSDARFCDVCGDLIVWDFLDNSTIIGIDRDFLHACQPCRDKVRAFVKDMQDTAVPETVSAKFKPKMIKTEELGANDED